MSDLKHTPGPWKWCVDDDPKREIDISTYEAPGYYDNPILFGSDGEEIVGCDEYWSINGTANALLVAAAPDLLFALEKCENQLSEFEGGGAFRYELELARTAIAKARGKI